MNVLVIDNLRMPKPHESKSERATTYREAAQEGGEKEPVKKANIVLNCLLDIHDEVQGGLCNGWAGYGRNLDAMVDVLRGGFEVDLDNCTIVLLNHKKMSNKELRVFQEAYQLGRDIVFQ